MTLVVTILSVCLVLALAAGVIETCIASWMIRRYKGIKANESSNKSAVENAERRHQAAVEALDDANRVHKGICKKTVVTLLMPARSTLIKTCKSSAKTAEKAKAKAILTVLNEIHMSVDEPKSREWMTALIEEIQTIIGEEL